MNDLLSAQYAIALDNHHPSNFAMVPHIIGELTYDYIDPDTGEIKPKRLSVYAKELYRVLLMVGGQENITWRNAENLAELANMSKGQVSLSKKELMQKFHQLDGTPLIEITEKNKSTRNQNGDKINGTIFHQITVKSVWHYQNAHLVLKKHEKQLNQGARSQCEPAEGARSQCEPALEGARSQCDRNNKHVAKKPLFKEQHSTPVGDSACSLNQDVDVSSSKERADEKTTWLNALLKIGCSVLMATNLIEKYTLHEIREAAQYVGSQMKKKKEKNEKCPNGIGYLQRTLENKWWVQKKC